MDYFNKFNKLAHKKSGLFIVICYFVFIVIIIWSVSAAMADFGNDNEKPNLPPIEVKSISFNPVTTSTTSTTTTTTTTMPDLSGIDWTELARSTYGKCGEYHDLAISVGWPEEEWKYLQQVIWRESRCQTDAWNGADAGLTQINKVHSKWLADMGWSHPNDMFSAQNNLTFALRLWETSGWKPWRFSGTTWGD
jgi:hypothetical protein